ncbi:single-stranded DNA-binding protein [Brevibacterium gallinarum]|uniref:Single-stranded DNA-binding protein n=1 Tax=Brevibacterium gallinarum TaxID=2762220 RepID=A0ABR8WTB5_9MICO|nr:single-stranded DNA-binding protein [Brevibacterium gallinarum]MBD8020314.1 single-stranded DNA-binding protein [Brevibacterium gallinarum]
MKQVNYFVGTAGADCQSGTLSDGRVWASFRLAVNFGFYDNEKGEYREIDTSWFDVSCYGDLALHVNSSVHKGDAVIVAGRLRIREWTDTTGTKSGKNPQIIAEAVGHNLRFGTANWARSTRNGAKSTAAGSSSGYDSLGSPPPTSHASAAPSDDIDDTMVDTTTGEIHDDHSMEPAGQS